MPLASNQLQLLVAFSFPHLNRLLGEAAWARLGVLAKEGAYSKAAQALRSRGIARPSSSVNAALARKHPQITSVTDCVKYTRPTYASVVLEMTQEQISAGFRRFPAASEAGSSGLRANHFDELLHVPQTDPALVFLTALTNVVNFLASGWPAAIAPWLAGAPLTALTNPDGEVRPIAVIEGCVGLSAVT